MILENIYTEKIRENILSIITGVMLSIFVMFFAWGFTSEGSQSILDFIIAVVIAGIITTLFGIGFCGDKKDSDKKLFSYSLTYFLLFIGVLSIVCLFIRFPNIPIWTVVLVGLVLLELFFWLDKDKPKKKESKFWFAAGKKLEALFESIVVLGILNLGRLAFNKLRLFENWNVILKWIGYIGAGLIALALVVGIIWLYIYLNSLKYKEKKK